MQGIDGVCRCASRDSAGRTSVALGSSSLTLTKWIKIVLFSCILIFKIYSSLCLIATSSQFIIPDTLDSRARIITVSIPKAYRQLVYCFVSFSKFTRFTFTCRSWSTPGKPVEITGKMLTSAKIETKNGDTRTRKPEPGYLNLSIYQFVSLKSPNSGYHQF